MWRLWLVAASILYAAGKDREAVLAKTANQARALRVKVAKALADQQAIYEPQWAPIPEHLHDREMEDGGHLATYEAFCNAVGKRKKRWVCGVTMQVLADCLKASIGILRPDPANRSNWQKLVRLQPRDATSPPKTQLFLLLVDQHYTMLVPPTGGWPASLCGGWPSTSTLKERGSGPSRSDAGTEITTSTLDHSVAVALGIEPSRIRQAAAEAVPARRLRSKTPSVLSCRPSTTSTLSTGVARALGIPARRTQRSPVAHAAATVAMEAPRTARRKQLDRTSAKKTQRTGELDMTDMLSQGAARLEELDQMLEDMDEEEIAKESRSDIRRRNATSQADPKTWICQFCEHSITRGDLTKLQSAIQVHLYHRHRPQLEQRRREMEQQRPPGAGTGPGARCGRVRQHQCGLRSNYVNVVMTTKRPLQMEENGWLCGVCLESLPPLDPYTRSVSAPAHLRTRHPEKKLDLQANKRLLRDRPETKELATAARRRYQLKHGEQQRAQKVARYQTAMQALGHLIEPRPVNNNYDPKDKRPHLAHWVCKKCRLTADYLIHWERNSKTPCKGYAWHAGIAVREARPLTRDWKRWIGDDTEARDTMAQFYGMSQEEVDWYVGHQPISRNEVAARYRARRQAREQAAKEQEGAVGILRRRPAAASR